jgi:hypothetical protein
MFIVVKKTLINNPFLNYSFSFEFLRFRRRLIDAASFYKEAHEFTPSFITGADNLSTMHLYKEELEDTKGGNQYP